MGDEKKTDQANPEGRSTQAPRGLVDQALAVHGLTAADCLAVKVVQGKAVLVTTTGLKIRWAPGEPPVEIPAYQRPGVKALPRRKAEAKKEK